MHLHHKEIIAWANGATIQYQLRSGGWSDVLGSPCWHATDTYRVKPPAIDRDKQVVDFGNDMMEALYDAHVAFALGGRLGEVGGCKPFDIKDYNVKYQAAIYSYCHGEVTALELVWRAMNEYREALRDGKDS